MKKCDPVQRTASTGFLTRFISALAGLAALVAAQAQPTISNVAPDGSRQFQYSPTLTFLASSTAAVTNVTVHLTGTTLTGVSRLKTLSLGSGLTSTGPAPA